MKERERRIDFLRGTAILFMTITHINAIYYTGSNSLIQFFTTIGATICFSIFLFCSAYVIGLKMKEGKNLSINGILTKSLKIYLTYLLLSFVITFSLTKTLSSENIKDIVLIIKPPEFAEFLIPLIVFNIFTIFSYKHLQKIQHNFFPLLLISIIIFLVGNYLYMITTINTYPTIVQIGIENLWGYENLHRFPFTFYLPIYMLGIHLSTLKTDSILMYMSFVGIFLITLFNIFDLSGWHRWPPSILFLSYGITYIVIIMFLFNKFKGIFSKNIFTNIERIGRYPLEQFILSTLLIFLPYILIGQSSSILLVISINMVVILTLITQPIVFHRNVV